MIILKLASNLSKYLLVALAMVFFTILAGAALVIAVPFAAIVAMFYALAFVIDTTVFVWGRYRLNR